MTTAATPTPACLGCARLEQPDCNTVVLLTGEVVCSWCEAWRLECHAREIAELTGKQHGHVMRDILAMLVELHGEGGVSSFGDTPTNHQNGQKYPIYPALIPSSVGAPVTMSSREIAELVGKQHSNIKISADRLSEKGVIGAPAMQGSPTTGPFSIAQPHFWYNPRIPWSG